MSESKDDADGDGGEPWQGGRSNILVAIRSRPLSDNERKRRDDEAVTVFDGTNIVVKDPGHTATNQMRQKRLRERRYAFDHAFGTSSGTEAVYKNTVKHLIDGVLAGQNATVFAYGATGSGKTFTMLGTPNSPGVMVRTLADLYSRMDFRAASTGASYRVMLSYVEVYNENIRDLLAPNPPGSSGSASDDHLDLREDPVKGNCVSGVSEHEVRDSGSVMVLLSEGNRRRTQEPTAANRESSRSHAVLQIVIAGRDGPTREGYGGKMRTGKLSLIDLAGSERAANTQNRGIRLLEGANINRSLLALGNCITALANKGAFVPYRDSKLTRLLKDSLGGNARTVMISCISPASSSFEETCNTLKYANRAKNIKTAPAPNKVSEAAFQVSEYDVLITGLRQEVAQLKVKLSEAHSGSTLPPGGVLDGMSFSLKRSISEEGEEGGQEEGELRAAEDSVRSPRRAGLGWGGGGASPSTLGARVAGPQGGSAETSTAWATLKAGQGMQQHFISGAVVAGPAIVSMASLSSPSLMRKTMRACAHALAGEGEGGSPRDGGSPTARAGAAADAAAARAAVAAAGGNVVVPEGYVLVNAAEAAAASDKLAALREALLQNFQERMQVRRSLAELQATNTENTTEIARKAASLVRLEASVALGAGQANRSGGAGIPALPSSKRHAEAKALAAALRRETSELQDATARNAKVRADLVSRLQRAESDAERLRSDLDGGSGVSSEERRELLGLEYRVYLLELQKVELEQAGLAHKAAVAAREAALRRARASVRVRDRMVRALLRMLGGTGGGGARAGVHAVARAAQAAVERVDGDLWCTMHEYLGSSSGHGGKGGGGGGPASSPHSPGRSTGGSREGSDESEGADAHVDGLAHVRLGLLSLWRVCSRGEEEGGDRGVGGLAYGEEEEEEEDEGEEEGEEQSNGEAPLFIGLGSSTPSRAPALSRAGREPSATSAHVHPPPRVISPARAGSKEEVGGGTQEGEEDVEAILRRMAQPQSPPQSTHPSLIPPSPRRVAWEGKGEGEGPPVAQGMQPANSAGAAASGRPGGRREGRAAGTSPPASSQPEAGVAPVSPYKSTWLERAAQLVRRMGRSSSRKKGTDGGPAQAPATHAGGRLADRGGAHESKEGEEEGEKSGADTRGPARVPAPEHGAWGGDGGGDENALPLRGAGSPPPPHQGATGRGRLSVDSTAGTGSAGTASPSKGRKDGFERDSGVRVSPVRTGPAALPTQAGTHAPPSEQPTIAAHVVDKGGAVSQAAGVGGGVGRGGRAAPRSHTNGLRHTLVQGGSALTGDFVSTSEIVAALTGDAGGAGGLPPAVPVRGSRQGALGTGRSRSSRKAGPGPTPSVPASADSGSTAGTGVGVPTHGRRSRGSSFVLDGVQVGDSLYPGVDDADAVLFGKLQAGLGQGGGGGVLPRSGRPSEASSGAQGAGAAGAGSGAVLANARKPPYGGRLGPLFPGPTAPLARAGHSAVGTPVGLGAGGAHPYPTTTTGWGLQEDSHTSGDSATNARAGGAHVSAPRAATNLAHAIAVYGGGPVAGGMGRH